MENVRPVVLLYVRQKSSGQIDAYYEGGNGSSLLASSHATLEGKNCSGGRACYICDPGSELRLGRMEKERKGGDNKWKDILNIYLVYIYVMHTTMGVHLEFSKNFPRLLT